MTMVAGAGVASAAPGYPVASFGSDGAVLHGYGLDKYKTSGGAGTVVASNGDIYQVGYADDATSTGQLYVARYLPNGTLDPTFGDPKLGGGIAYPTVDGVKSSASSSGPFGSSASIALTASGEPVVLTEAETTASTYEPVVLELTQSGTLDTSFNHAGTEPGVETIQINGRDTYGAGLAVQSNGQIVLTGGFDDASGNGEFFAERLNGDGTVDTDFGAGGSGVEAMQLGQDGSYSTGTAVVTQADGDLAFSAIADDASGNDQFAVVRLTASGQPDPSFGSAGVAYAQPSTATKPSSEPISIAATSDGGYALAGEAEASAVAQLAISRFNASGQPDSSFGSNGTFLLPADSSNGMTLSAGTAIFAQPDGKLIVSGLGGDIFGTPSSSFDGIAPLVMRLNADGSVDSAFGYGGQLAATPSTEGFNLPEGAAETPDGNLYLSGIAGNVLGGSSESILEEFNLDAAPAVVIASSSTSVQSGTPVQLTAAAIGADGEPINQVSWDFGSGSFGAATGTSATKTFTTPGTYSVRVKATDGFGLSTVSTQTITVTPAPASSTSSSSPSSSNPPSSTPVTPAQVIAPALKLVKISVKHGQVKVTLLCAFAACKVNANLTTHTRKGKGKTGSLSANGRGTTVSVGSTNVSMAANATHTFTIKLNKAGRKLLASFKRIPAKASFKLTNTSGKTITHVITIH